MGEATMGEATMGEATMRLQVRWQQPDALLGRPVANNQTQLYNTKRRIQATTNRTPNTTLSFQLLSSSPYLAAPSPTIDRKHLIALPR